jgi:hypothetical protein
MSVLGPALIEADNLSVAWGRALLHTCDNSNSALSPMLISISNFAPPIPQEAASIRKATDAALSALKLNPVRVSALTIFPYEMWCRRNKPPCAEFTSFCLDRLLPRLKKLDARNRLGTYFERMMGFVGIRRGELYQVNQLLFIIDLLRNRKKWPRESALQMSCFDPAKDHTGQPVRGFPCLQQVSVSHDNSGNFALSAYYPTQYIFDRAYGNYLGLCHLGAFIAHETRLNFVRLNCYVGRPEIGSVSRKKIQGVLTVVRQSL